MGGYWYPARKITVQGEVDWLNAQVSFSENNGRRVVTGVVTGNALPVGHQTGNFLIDFYDPVYQIDWNPNPIMGCTIQLSLPLDPNLAATASCVSMGMVEIPLNRVVVYNALDDAERNARPMRSRTGALDIFRDRVSIITTAPALTRVRHINWCIR